MKLQFFGAAGNVTGSRTLLSTAKSRILVDCGMFQGHKENRLRNWEPLDVGPLDAVVLTHAHLDHSGWVPALIARGYKGPVYCTTGSAQLLKILWPDAGRIQEDDAAHANRRGSSKHQPALPMFTEEQAIAALKSLRPIEFDTRFEIGDLSLHFRTAGHILGASSVLVQSAERSVLFSGDVGRPNDLVMPAPVPPPAVDVMVMESTYGQRTHSESDLLGSLAEVVNRTFKRDGMVLIPSFAVGRAQSLLWALHTLMETDRIPRVPIVVDSPMATEATHALVNNPVGLRLSTDQLHAMCEHVEFVGSVQQSKALHARTERFILISASGMLTGGRVLHHLERRAPVERNTLLFVGFQAPGTRGARLVAGESPVKLYGNMVEVRCEVAEIGGLSAHADSDELCAWLGTAPSHPRRMFLNHGEPDAANALRTRLEEQGYDVVVATEGVAWDLDDLRPLSTIHVVGESEERGERAADLHFSTESDFERLRAALTAMETGDMPSAPIQVDGAALLALARRLKLT